MHASRPRKPIVFELHPSAATPDTQRFPHKRFPHPTGTLTLSKIAFLFPGQGAQTIGMGRQAAETLPAARQLYDRANEILGYDLARLCFEGPPEELDSTVCSQPALFVTSLVAIELLRQSSPEVVLSCEATAGLSLGEYTALVFAGAMEFEDGLRLVAVRGEAMQEASDATPSGMVSILGLERAQVEALCDQARQGEVLQIANFLCPGNIVISGTNSACERAAEMAPAAGAMKAVPLAVAGAFHTPIMGSAVDRLKDALADARITRPAIPVISNVDARAHAEPDEIRQLLLEQVVSPVRWEESMRSLLGLGYDQFYEVGPGRVLRGLLKRMERRISCQGVFD
jgi:[acyl-carrier-protein] S-malonyltransferase